MATPPQLTPDFTLSVSPTSSSVTAGSTNQVSLSATAVNNFSGQINIQVSGLPAGVSTLPANLALTPGNPLQVTISATAATTPTSTTVTFTGTSGSLSHNAPLSLSVVAALSNRSPGRTRYVRTDAVTEYLGWLNTHWMVYEPSNSRIYMTDPQGNQVFVIDSVSQTEIASISIPGAFGIDDTPDHKTLYVGTFVGDVYAIDIASTSVTHRYVASEIGPYGYQAFTVQVMADGRLALMGAQGGIPSVDGTPGFAIWNPTDNSIVIYGGAPNGVPTVPDCVGNVGGFTRTADRTSILLGSIDSDTTLCEVNETTGKENYITVSGSFATRKIISSPDGNYLVFPNYPSGIVLYDGHTLNQVAAFDVAGDTSSASAMAFSADSKTLYVPSSTIIYAYDVASHQLLGWVPNITVEPSSGGSAIGAISGPNFAFGDSAGMLAGPMEEGVGFVDVSSLNTGPVGTQFLNAYLSPAAGPTTGGTQAGWAAPVVGVKSIYFGNQEAPAIVNTTQYYMEVTTPPGPPGPVDINEYANDGGIQYIPEGFSYGPAILQVTPDTSTSDGGGVGIVFGYGFVPVTATTLPSDLQVTVGGKPATIVGFDPNAYGLLSPPFPLESVAFTIPPGSIGNADVVVTNSIGSTTAPGALHYIPALQQFPLANAALAQGIYDPHRDLYYFTDSSQIQIFSRSQGAWLAPVGIPNPAGKNLPGKQRRLWSLALSPDGTKLAIADIAGDVIYLLNPSNPTAVQFFTIPPPIPSEPANYVANPAGVAISDEGVVYIGAEVTGGTGFNPFYKLDTNTGIATAYNLLGTNSGGDAYLRVAISNDNSRVFFNDDGEVFSIDTATDTVHYASSDPGCCYGSYELSLSSNQTTFAATAVTFDTNLNAQANLTFNDRESPSISYVYGAKLSPDGSLLFQPSVSGVDIFDGRLGYLRSRIALPLALSANYDALVSDGKDNILVAITGTGGSGIAILDLTSIAEPSPLSYEAESSLGSNFLKAPSAQSIDRTIPGANSNARAAQKQAQRSIRYFTKSPLSR